MSVGTRAELKKGFRRKYKRKLCSLKEKVYSKEFSRWALELVRNRGFCKGGPWVLWKPKELWMQTQRAALLNSTFLESREPCYILPPSSDEHHPGEGWSSPPHYTGDWPAVLALVRVVGAGLQLCRSGRELRAAHSGCSFCVREPEWLVSVPSEMHQYTLGRREGTFFRGLEHNGGNGDCNLGMDVHVSSYVPTAFEALGTFGYASLAKKVLFSTWSAKDTLGSRRISPFRIQKLARWCCVGWGSVLQ